MPQQVRRDAGLLKRLEDALNRALSRAVSWLIPRLFGGNREQRAPLQRPDSEESATFQEPDTPRPDLDALSILKEAPDDPAPPDEP
ncbi:MAG: hypothetical protein NT090_04915, partial [Acidobacteria bacterium]|nr:hypothetical protein [Acidobacteriota bacterium]